MSHTAASARPVSPHAPPAQVVIPSPNGAEAGPSLLPVLGLVSLLAHGAVLGLIALLPAASSSILVSPERVTVEVRDPAPPPAAAAVEPEPVPVTIPTTPPPTLARPRPVRHVSAAPVAEPAPAPPTLTAVGETTSETASAGSPDGQIGGMAGGQGTQVNVQPPPPAPTLVEPPRPSQADLRRLLLAYLEGTLGRFVTGRLDYPLAARREHLEGVVVLRIRLDDAGRILSVRVGRSSGHGTLDEAAIASVRGLSMVPAPPPEIPWDSRVELPLPVTYELR